MTDSPYTNADLRTEAARQHFGCSWDPDYMGVGEQMDEAPWTSLTEEQFDEAQRKIHDLINGAADVSEWAINLGADGLEAEEHQITVQGDGRPIARIHFAFEPDMSDEMRTALVEGIGQAIGDAL